MCAVARKLGHYDAEHHEIKHVNWTPKVYEPVYLCKVNRDIDLQEIAKTSIGRLPGSDMSIPIKNINALVTHNTAVLGILGVGKSCLTFELIKKIVAAGIKVICLDITNQYASDNGLYKYIPEAQIVSDLRQEKIDELKSQSMRTGTSDSKSSWGNVKDFKKLMESAVSGFMDANNKSVISRSAISRGKSGCAASSHKRELSTNPLFKSSIISSLKRRSARSVFG